MKELFIPYNLALELQSLGFDEECFAWYNYGSLTFFEDDAILGMYAGEENRPFAPLFQQIFDWFEKEHNLFSIIRIGYGDPKWYDYLIQNGRESWSEEEISYNTPREARIACIKELITLTKKS